MVDKVGISPGRSRQVARKNYLPAHCRSTVSCRVIVTPKLEDVTVSSASLTGPVMVVIALSLADF